MQPTDAERQEIADWKRIESKQNEAREEVRRRIRRILGNGWEQAIAQRLDGVHVELPTEPWRTNEGIRVLLTGNVRTNGPFVKQPVEPTEHWPVFLPESAVSKCLVSAWTPSPSKAAAGSSEATVRRTGGRPPKHDWTPFIRQVIRIASLDGGDLTGTEFRKRMKDWAAVNMPDPPDERTIEKKLAELVSDDLLTD
jgi:hypothetical protein